MNVLIVRLGALGDVVHAIPVAVALRRAWPDARIDWLVSARHREILDLVPALTRVVAINDRGGVDGGLPVRAAVATLRATGYDVAIDLQGLFKSALFARLSGAQRVIGFCRRHARESLASLLYTETYDPGGPGIHAPDDPRHVVDINLGVLGLLGLTPEAPSFELAATPSAPVAQAIADAGGRFALLNPGAGWPNKRWPPERFGALASALRERFGLWSLVLWGPGEQALARAVVDAASGAAALAPQTTIADIAALAHASAVMVSGDTGPTHIAAAVRAPLVGIYGPTSPERNGPFGSADEAVSRANVCQCHHLRQCRLPRMCLLDIDVAEVLAAVERRLASSERSRG